VVWIPFLTLILSSLLSAILSTAMSYCFDSPHRVFPIYINNKCNVHSSVYF
jgi:hypothetical protein